MKTYKTDNRLLVREIAGEHVLVPTGELALTIHGMISLSESGYLLWKCMCDGAYIDDMVKLILSEYEIDETTALNDVKDFINRMMKLGIIREVEDEK